MIESVDTSGRAVLFAGIIVCIALLGLFALGRELPVRRRDRGVYRSGVHGASPRSRCCPRCSASSAIRVLRRRERRALKAGRAADDRRVGAAGRAGPACIEKRPALFAAVAAGVMILIAIPFFSMRLGSADAGSDPSGSTTRKAYDLLAKGFGPGYNGPLQLVAQVSGPEQEAQFTQRRSTPSPRPRASSVRRSRTSSPAARREARGWRSPTSIPRGLRRPSRPRTCSKGPRHRRPGRDPRHRTCTSSSAARRRSSSTSAMCSRASCRCSSASSSCSASCC